MTPVSLKIRKFSVFLDLNTTTPQNYIIRDGSETQDRVGPGGGGGGLRLLVHLRGGGREYHRPRISYHGPGGDGPCGEDGGQHHHQPYHHDPHHCGAPQQLGSLHHLHRHEEGGGTPGQGAQQSGGDGVYIFLKHSIRYITVLHSTLYTVYYRTVFFILHPTVYNTVQFVL